MANRVASDAASGAQCIGVFGIADFAPHDLQLMSGRRQIGLSGRSAWHMAMAAVAKPAAARQPPWRDTNQPAFTEPGAVRSFDVERKARPYLLWGR